MNMSPTNVETAVESLKPFARKIRRVFLQAWVDVQPGAGRHDRDLCDLAVRAIGRVIPAVTYHWGIKLIPGKGLQEHWWVSVDGIVVDITCEQFGVEGGVIVHPETTYDWHPQFSSASFAKAMREHEKVFGIPPCTCCEKKEKKVLRRFNDLWSHLTTAKKKPKKVHTQKRQKKARQKSRG